MGDVIDKAELVGRDAGTEAEDLQGQGRSEDPQHC